MLDVMYNACVSCGTRKRTGQTERSMAASILKLHRVYLPIRIWFFAEVEGEQMTKKLSASSRPAKQINASAESIWNKPLTERQKAALQGVAKRQKQGDVADIDYTDIPAFTDKQLTQFRLPAQEVGGRASGCRCF